MTWRFPVTLERPRPGGGVERWSCDVHDATVATSRDGRATREKQASNAVAARWEAGKQCHKMLLQGFVFRDEGAASGQPVLRLGVGQLVDALDVVPDRGVLHAATTNRAGTEVTLRICDLRSGSHEEAVVARRTSQTFVHAALVDRRGRTFLQIDRELLVFDELGSEPRRFARLSSIERCNPHVVRPQIDAARERVLCVDGAARIVLFDLDGTVLFEQTIAAKLRVAAIGLAPDATRVAVHVIDASVRDPAGAARATTNQIEVFDVASARRIAVLPVELSATRLYLASGSGDAPGTDLVSADSWQPAARLLRLDGTSWQPTAARQFAALSSDGSLLVTAGTATPSVVELRRTSAPDDVVWSVSPAITFPYRPSRFDFVDPATILVAGSSEVVLYRA